jgi:nitroreductase
MDVKEAIAKRRAYRALDPVAIEDDIIRILAEAASLAPSCMNNQPWRFVLVKSDAALAELKKTLSKWNAWAQKASMIVAVCARKEDDCQNPDGRDHYMFDTGMAAAFLLLRATEIGIVAHPIAGYDHAAAKKALSIPDEHTLIALIIVGKHGSDLTPLSEKQIAQETARPPRKPLAENFFRDRWGG